MLCAVFFAYSLTDFRLTTAPFLRKRRKISCVSYLLPGNTTMIGGLPGTGIRLPTGSREPGGQIPDINNAATNKQLKIFFFILCSFLLFCLVQSYIKKNICQATVAWQNLQVHQNQIIAI